MLKVEVTNTLGRTIGRADHSFEGDAEYPQTVEVDAGRLGEILDCPHLDATVVGADDMGEVPPGVPVSFEATVDALALARAAGVDLFALAAGSLGSGEDGKIYVKDVREAAGADVGGAASLARTIEPEIGYASTTDSPEEQRKAEERAMREMTAASVAEPLRDGNVGSAMETDRAEETEGVDDPEAEEADDPEETVDEADADEEFGDTGFGGSGS